MSPLLFRYDSLLFLYITTLANRSRLSHVLASSMAESPNKINREKRGGKRGEKFVIS